MNTHSNRHPGVRGLLSLLVSLQVGFFGPVYADTVALATSPLLNATTTTVKPNLMFLMDNSGSMSQEYTPDWLQKYNVRNDPWEYDGEWNSPSTAEKNCRDSADDDEAINTAIDHMDMCVVGDVPFMTSAINSQYYNPEIRYRPGVNADGSSLPSQTDPTTVLLDGYGKHNRTQLGDTSSTTINLTTKYPDRVWCTTKNPTPAQLIDTLVCQKNSGYLYPNATYKYGRGSDWSTANKNVLGILGAPYYYTVVVSEYCKEAELRNCTTSALPTGDYTFPAKARYCSDTGLLNCQSTRTSTYKYPRYPGATTAAVAAQGSFRVGSNTPRTITSVKVNNVEILGAAVTGTSRADLASKVAARINTYVSNPEYTAVVFSTDYVRVTSTAAAGATANGTIEIAGSAGSGSRVNVAGGVTGGTAPAYTFARTDIVSTTTSYPKSIARTDCSGTDSCNYNEEITNFANWYAYYRTRMQSMKSSVSLAFKPIGSNYRVGFINICKGDYLPVDSFDNATLYGGVAGEGSFRVGDSSPRTITSVKVNGVETLGVAVTGTSRSNLASKVAAQINTYVSNPEYTAVVFSTDYVRVTSTAAVGADANGTISITGSAGSSNRVDVAGGVTPLGQKSNWYKNLFAQTASGCGTPLREALATVGRIFAGKELSSAGTASGSEIDPVQYSCQQNFALLTTDGYWNGNGGLDLDGVAIGNLDGGTTERVMHEGPTASSNSLADGAKYYYETDLRTADLSNCTGSLGVDVCENNVFKSNTDNNDQQHMTTFTLGLGVDGTLSYVSDYDSATSGDFYNLKNGSGSPTVYWPVPAANSETAVDDLWHAAVNGRGKYFSAKDPAQLATGLSAALAAIGSKVGSASAAATSSLNPVPGNNYAYVASYSTTKWQGNLEARTINTLTGAVSKTASWCVESITSSTCSSPSTVETDGSGSSSVSYCVTPDSTAGACTNGVMEGTSCKVQIPVVCSGTMQSLIAGSTDDRSIYKASSSGGLESFTYAHLDSEYFTGTGLSQWSVLTESQKTLAAGENLVNYLRGQTGFEERSSNTAQNRLYRFREATLGDILESQPFFMGKPVFSYSDSGYSAFKAANASRSGNVYVGANDGMLHAFESETGIERWAFVPTAVIPNMWRLADKNYSTMHTNFINGSPTVSDICVENCSCDQACVDAGGSAPVWKTVLVGGLSAGGRSYYALDVTDPDTPALLWEISSDSAGYANLGYGYGQPVFTKKQDGTWVVLIASGYNNVSPGDGKGYLFVVDAATGNKLSEISTTEGSVSTPSGLAKIAAWNEFQGVDNTAGYVYGGDLLGNLWRFDINAGEVFKLAMLKDAGGNAQPVTTAPTLGKVKGQRVVFIGTGKYLEVSDLTNVAAQTIYAIRDDGSESPVTLDDAREALVEQELTRSGNARTSTNNTVDFIGGRGWYVDLKDSTSSPEFVGERVNIDMKLVNGILIAASIVPSNTVCSPGGYGWLNYFNYQTGSSSEEDGTVSAMYLSPIVGVNTIYIQGETIAIISTGDGNVVKDDVPPGEGGADFTGRRVMWRELVQ